MSIQVSFAPLAKCDLISQLKKWETNDADGSEIQRKDIPADFGNDSATLVGNESGSHRGRRVVLDNDERSDGFCGRGNEKSRVSR